MYTLQELWRGQYHVCFDVLKNIQANILDDRLRMVLEWTPIHNHWHCK